MTRKALIIILPGEKNSKWYLPGTLKDLQNYDSYLKTSVGGKWESSEFDYLINPTKSQILQKIKYINENYSLVVYSGHGGINTYNGGFYVETTDGNLHSNNLKTSSSRQLIVFDTCRSFFSEELNESSFMGSSNLLEGTLGLNDSRRIQLNKSFESRLLIEDFTDLRYKDIWNSRTLYNNHLGICETGIISLYSSQVGQASGDSKDNGGYYSSSLILSSYLWNNEPSDGSQILDIYDADKRANKIMKELYLTNQDSEINGGRRRMWYPFAVR